MAKKSDFFREGEHDDHLENVDRYRTKRCTPEILREYILKIGHYPTMLELKGEFGAILGPIMCGHELQKTGRYPIF
jgi:hypothetical protein